MSRLLALLVALALIAGAVVIRNAIEDDEPVEDGRQAVMHLVCPPEVARACEGLGLRYEVTIEDAAVTADRLSTVAEPDVDLWLALQPWPAIVEEERARIGLGALFDEVDAVARSRLVAVAPESAGACDWRCLGAGDLTLGSRRLDSGLGLLHLGAAASGYFDGSGFATNDFDPAFRSWLATLLDHVSAADQPVTRLLQGPFFQAALSFEAEAAAALEAAHPDRRSGLALLYPEPMAYLDVAVADAGELLEDRAADLPRVLAEALGAVGWDASSDEPTGLPRPGVLVALRSELP